MKTAAALLLAGLLLVQQALPCSTFFINHNGQMVFGRNYDWVVGTGLLCTNQRGLVKTGVILASEFVLRDCGTRRRESTRHYAL